MEWLWVVWLKKNISNDLVEFVRIFFEEYGVYDGKSLEIKLKILVDKNYLFLNGLSKI